MIESLRKQIFEGAGAKDMKLVTTRRVWRHTIADRVGNLNYSLFIINY
jgi:hypothetical protein